jgi:hypothetical protein
MDGTLFPLAFRPRTEDAPDYSGHKHAYSLSALIVCDDRNNTPTSIDQGVLNVAVYIKPTRPVKFILVDLVITGTGVDFNELI